MTPKEKAKQLFDKYTKFQNGYGYEYKTKQCALISVDEIINSNPHSNPLNTEIYSTMEYWQEVKHEIENL